MLIELGISSILDFSSRLDFGSVALVLASVVPCCLAEHVVLIS